MTTALRWPVSLVVAFATTAAAAQSIYRCGNSYSPVPCAQAKELAVEEPPTAAQRAEGRRVAASERRLAATMTRERREQEAALRPALAVSLGPSPPAAAASAPAKKHAQKRRPAKALDPDRDFIAAVPKARK